MERAGLAWPIAAGIAAIGAAAGLFLAKRRSRRGRGTVPAAFARSQGRSSLKAGAIRDAGPDAMRDPPKCWSATDEASDESFPASDPPA